MKKNLVIILLFPLLFSFTTRKVKKGNEFTYISVELTGIRTHIHSEECKLINGGVIFYISDNSSKCPVRLETISGKYKYSGLMQPHSSWKRWVSMKVAPFLTGRRDYSPNNIGYKQIYKIKSKDFDLAKMKLNLRYGFQQCHTQNGFLGIGSVHGRNCSVFTDSGLIPKTRKLNNFVDNQMETSFYIQSNNTTGTPKHDIRLYFKIEILK